MQDRYLLKLVYLLCFNFLICYSSFSQERIYITKSNSKHYFDKPILKRYGGALIILKDNKYATWLVWTGGLVWWSERMPYEFKQDTLILNPINKCFSDVLLISKNKLISLEMPPMTYYKRKRIPKTAEKLLIKYPPTNSTCELKSSY